MDRIFLVARRVDGHKYLQYYCGMGQAWRSNEGYIYGTAETAGLVADQYPDAFVVEYIGQREGGFLLS